MSEGIGRLLAAGNVAEVFEWGSCVVKLYRSAGAKEAVFREAGIHAAVEALGLPVPAIWSVRQIADRWGIVFDRVRGPSFAERMRGIQPLCRGTSRYLRSCRRAFTPIWPTNSGV
jgi:hypothetical protein